MLRVCRWIVRILLAYGLVALIWSTVLKFRGNIDEWLFFDRFVPPMWLQIVLVVVGFFSLGVVLAGEQKPKDDLRAQH